MEVKIGDMITFGRIYRPSKVKAVFKTRLVTESGVRVDLKTMQVIDDKVGAWRIFAHVESSDETVLFQDGAEED